MDCMSRPLEPRRPGLAVLEPPMRCYFNLRRGDEFVLDRNGLDVSDLVEARREAQAAVCETLESVADPPGLWVEWVMEVTDADGAVLFSIPLDAAFC